VSGGIWMSGCTIHPPLLGITLTSHRPGAEPET
jgi:hypothetical protein